MTWRHPAHRPLVEAILYSFRAKPEEARARLSRFRAEHWAQTDFWLYASGMALYFLDHVRRAGIEDVVDTEFLTKLQTALAQNMQRVVTMFDEFVALNRTFERSRIRYANVKGFTLCPGSCHDVALRHQIDFDFLVEARDLPIYRAHLAERGYVLTAATQTTWEFKAGNHAGYSSQNRYSAGDYRAVELHFQPQNSGMETNDDRLERIVSWKYGGVTAPALSPADQLIGQALHLLGHLRSDNTRPSWLLEYRHHVLMRSADEKFWKSVRELAQERPNAAVAFGISSLLAAQMFGAFSVPALDEWTLSKVPANIRLWCATYGSRAVLADFPGTKLYLLLENEIATLRQQQYGRLYRRLVPIHSAPRLFQPSTRNTAHTSLKRTITQSRFVLFRLRFHLVEGARYLLESRRWKRTLERNAVDISATNGSSTALLATRTNASKG